MTYRGTCTIIGNAKNGNWTRLLAVANNSTQRVLNRPGKGVGTAGSREEGSGTPEREECWRWAAVSD